MGMWGMIAGAGMEIAGAAGQYAAGQSAADAAGQAAIATQRAAEQQRRDTMGYAAPTALELANMNAQLQQSGTALARQAKLFASIDPVVLEASKQALQLMRGQDAQTIAPMLAQRKVQREQLMQQLTQQLGPGGASSSAGQQALQNFDLQTSMLQTQLQQQGLGVLTDITKLGTQSAHASGTEAGQLFGSLGTQTNNVATRQASSSINTSLVPYASAPWVQSLASAQNLGQLFGNISRMGGQALGASSGGQVKPLDYTGNPTGNQNSAGAGGGTGTT